MAKRTTAENFERRLRNRTGGLGFWGAVAYARRHGTKEQKASAEQATHDMLGKNR